MSGFSPRVILLFVLEFYFWGGLTFDSMMLLIVTITMFFLVWMMADFDLMWFGAVLILNSNGGGQSSAHWANCNVDSREAPLVG